MSNSEQSNNEMTPQDEQLITNIDGNDVLLGRGAGPNEHTGNVRFRMVVSEFKASYLATRNRKVKNKIALKAMRTIKAKKGRFLQRVKGRLDDVYVLANEDVVLEKTKQALRHLAKPKADATKQEVPKKQRPSQPSKSQSAGISVMGHTQNVLAPKHERSQADLISQFLRESMTTTPPVWAAKLPSCLPKRETPSQISVLQDLRKALSTDVYLLKSPPSTTDCVASLLCGVSPPQPPQQTKDISLLILEALISSSQNNIMMQNRGTINSPLAELFQGNNQHSNVPDLRAFISNAQILSSRI